MTSTIAGRLCITLLLGAVLNAAAFEILWQLVNAPGTQDLLMQATRIEFTRMRQDTEVASKRDDRVELEQPPEVPQLPKLSVSAGSIDSNVISLAPVVDARSALMRMNMSAGSDRDVIPLVRIAPDYPPRALNRGIEGWVLVQFTISANGSVTDAVVIDAEPKGTFDEAALKAIARWRYNPKVEGGEAVERVGIRTVLRFVIEK